MGVQCRHLVKRVFNMSAILILSTYTADDVSIHRCCDQALLQWAPLQHHRLLQLINGVELLAVVDLLLYGPKMA